jgi:hypothetical protein
MTEHKRVAAAPYDSGIEGEFCVRSLMQGTLMIYSLEVGYESDPLLADILSVNPQASRTPVT